MFSVFLKGEKYRMLPQRIIDKLTEQQIAFLECFFAKCNESFYEGYDEEGNPTEGISVDDAAEIWLSHGKDEDYMFGYSEEELEDAL